MASDESGKEPQPLDRLGVREEIDRAFTNPPAAWLERIEAEVEARVTLREKYYRIMFGAVVLAASLALWLFFRKTDASVREEVAKQMAAASIEQARRTILTAASSAEADQQIVNRMTAEVRAAHDDFVARLAELRRQDNLVLAEADGSVHIRGPLWLASNLMLDAGKPDVSRIQFVRGGEVVTLSSNGVTGIRMKFNGRWEQVCKGEVGQTCE
jgi:hypothetical protein